MSNDTQTTAVEKLRLDKWLWYTRVIKSRTLAQKLITSGAVRVDSQRVTGADYKISPGMIVTMTVHEKVRIFKVLKTGTRRGPAPEAQSLYEDLSPVVANADRPYVPGAPAQREPGSGRPTKKERRATNLFHNFSDPD